jgi:hypothetical protein
MTEEIKRKTLEELEEEYKDVMNGHSAAAAFGDHEYNLNSVMQRTGWMSLGQTLAPFFTDENWNKLMQLRQFYYDTYNDKFEVPSTNDKVISEREYAGLLRYATVAQEMQRWFDGILEAIQAVGKEQEERSKRQHEEYEKIMDELDKVTEDAKSLTDLINNAFNGATNEQT